MKRIGMSICALMCFVALNIPCMAQGNPWNGSWKADASSMRFSGPTFSVAADAGGYTITRDGKPMPKVVCNGRPNTGADGMTTICTKSAAGYEVKESRNGKPMDTVQISMSADGKMMTRKAKIYPDDGGTSFVVITQAKRLSGGPGFSGVWKAVSFDEPQDSGILSIEVKGDSVAFKETDNDKPVTCKLDGTPTKFGDRSMSVRLEGSHTLKVTYRGKDGKVQRENTFVLSPSGKTVTETDITPEPSPSRMSLMFHKA